MARNQQLLLKEESYFDKVADPSAGSYYIENLTHLVGNHAWKLFVDIEKEGGFLQALRAGRIQDLLSESAAKRKKDTATRRKILVGTNQYTGIEEQIPRQAELNRISGEGPGIEGRAVRPINLHRGSEEFERLRLEVSLSGRQPLVFLLTIGDKVMRKARARFAAGFFGCAGYRIVENDGFDTLDEAIKASLSSEADITVICSSEGEYPGYAREIYARLNDKTIIVIAGDPDKMSGQIMSGTFKFIHHKSDVPETLRCFNKLLGIELSVEQTEK